MARKLDFDNSITRALVLALVTTAACSNDSTLSPVGASSTSSTGNVITITADGASPQTVRIQVGGRVTFVNNDSVDHDMSSDQHPTHLACPEINQVGYLRPGQTRETGNFVRSETCTFHDHINADNASLNGTIIISE